MNLISVGVEGIRSILLANATIVANVSTKIFRNAAPGNSLVPYIIIIHLSGGEQNLAPSRSFDMTFRVEGVSPDQVIAETLANEIEKSLTGMTPAFLDGWIAWTPITGLMPHEEVTNVQNIPYYRQGSQYRIRATKSTGD